MKTIFSDFDGVLFDSVKEAYLLTRCSIAGIDVMAPLHQQDYLRFRKYRYLIVKSWQFYYIYNLIQNKISDENFEAEYKKCLLNTDEITVKEFDKGYVKAREDLIKRDFDFWDNLDTPYDFFFSIKNLVLKNNYKFVIMTNKKKLPVENKLKKYSFNVEVFANEDMQNYSSKGELMQHYMQKNGIKECYFIEDSIENIKSCEKYNNIKGLLANWGYVHPNTAGYSPEQILEIIEKEI